jgi:ribonuclease P protein component
MKAGLLKSKCFTLDERIKRASEIRNLFKNGKRVSIAGAKMFFLPNNREFNRIGFPLPRGFGNAIERNRAKRFSRETYRNLKSYLNTGYDILFLVYPPAEKDSFHSRCDQFQSLCKKAGLLKEFTEQQ